MEGCKASRDPKERGIMLRAAADIVAHIQRVKDVETDTYSEDVTTFSVKATYLEIYQETLTDLLCEPGGQADLKIRIDPDSLSGHELYVQGLTEHEVSDIDDYVQVIILTRVMNTRQLEKPI
ncbi:hypothetical protein HKX48_000650 [Thoreauomyces humboldtii]|nr:hypothetical protein HKX48_000650 [Thoreauomyces humboldtii]